ncbi:MAG: hypothetical protein ACOC8P_00480 [Dichotomicrobium sp.]
MNRFRQFERLLPTERRVYAEVTSVRTDGTSIVQTPEGRVFRARGTGIPAGSKAFVLLPQGKQPRLDGTAPDLPMSEFTNL